MHLYVLCIQIAVLAFYCRVAVCSRINHQLIQLTATVGTCIGSSTPGKTTVGKAECQAVDVLQLGHRRWHTLKARYFNQPCFSLSIFFWLKPVSRECSHWSTEQFPLSKWGPLARELCWVLQSRDNVHGAISWHFSTVEVWERHWALHSALAPSGLDLWVSSTSASMLLARMALGVLQ